MARRAAKKRSAERSSLTESEGVDSELVIGLIGPVGANLEPVRTILARRLENWRYRVVQIRITSDVIPRLVRVARQKRQDEAGRIEALMDAGDLARKRFGNDILALGAIDDIARGRELDGKGEPKPRTRHAYIIRSLKHPEEVAALRRVYSYGFFLIGVHADEDHRRQHLKERGVSASDAERLMARDAEDHTAHGQKVTETFHRSDFFVRIEKDSDRLKHSLERSLDIIFGNPFCTPVFDEYAMFLAHASSLRSADMSRQVGAVVTRENEVLATGANDCPKAGGGQYWPTVLPNGLVRDVPEGRDYTRGFDANAAARDTIIEQIVDRAASQGANATVVRDAVRMSGLMHVTEFGRVVHAEMDALLSCCRTGVMTLGTTLYVTTFPCHNCAKHIVSAGVGRVVFIEPYQKSRAKDHHPDSIRVGLPGTRGVSAGDDPKVPFEPFVGVGPRRFFELFSMNLGSGYPLVRKDAQTGRTAEWKANSMRMPMRSSSYLGHEVGASLVFQLARRENKETEDAREAGPVEGVDQRSRRRGARRRKVRGKQ